MARTLDVECEIMNEQKEAAEKMLISCLLQDLSLISETPLIEDDFSTPKNKFYFKLVSELSTRYREVNEFTVINFLKLSEALTQDFEDYGGAKEFKKIKELANVENFYSHLDEVIKYNLIEEVSEKLAIDINKEISVGGKKIVPADKFTSMSSQQVLDFFDMQLSSVNVRSVATDMVREYLFYSDEELEQIEEGEVDDDTTYYDTTLTWETENGEFKYHKNFPLLSKSTDGLSSGNGVAIFGAFSGVGKTTLITNIAMSLVENGEKVILVSNEQQIKYFRTMLLSYISAYVFGCFTLNRTKIKHFNFNDEEKKVFLKANKFIKERYKDTIAFYSVSEFSVDKIMREAKKLILAEGFSTLIVETFKAESQEDSVKELMANSVALDKFGKEMNCKILLPMQLMGSMTGKASFLTSSLLAGSKHVKDVAGLLLLTRKVNPKELDEEDDRMFLKPYVWRKDRNGNFKKKYFKIVDKTTPTRRRLEGDFDDELTLDKNKHYILAFLDKCREASDSNIIILQEFNGDYGRIKDVAYVDNVYTGLFY